MVEWRLLRPAVVACLLGACTAVRLAEPDRLLSEDQVVDLIERPERWLGRTVTMRIYPYDNGFAGSYVACLEPCAAAGADRSIFVVYTAPERFRGYRGDRAETVRAQLRRTCPRGMPLCLDAPIRLFGLHEAAAPGR
jgi:hypothetical protein